MENHMFEHDENAGFFHGWHLDKRVSVAHIFATLGFAFGLASWQWAEHERVSVLTTHFEAQKITQKSDMQAHAAVDEAKDAAFLMALENIREKDREMLAAMNRQYAEILSRLASIDKAMATHLENASKNK